MDWIQSVSKENSRKRKQQVDRELEQHQEDTWRIQAGAGRWGRAGLPACSPTSDTLQASPPGSRAPEAPRPHAPPGRWLPVKAVRRSSHCWFPGHVCCPAGCSQCPVLSGSPVDTVGLSLQPGCDPQRAAGTSSFMRGRVPNTCSSLWVTQMIVKQRDIYYQISGHGQQDPATTCQSGTAGHFAGCGTMCPILPRGKRDSQAWSLQLHICSLGTLRPGQLEARARPPGLGWAEPRSEPRSGRCRWRWCCHRAAAARCSSWEREDVCQAELPAREGFLSKRPVVTLVIVVTSERVSSVFPGATVLPFPWLPSN